MCVSVCKHLLSLPFKVAQGKGNRERDREGKKQRKSKCPKWGAIWKQLQSVLRLRVMEATKWETRKRLKARQARQLLLSLLSHLLIGRPLIESERSVHIAAAAHIAANLGNHQNWPFQNLVSALHSRHWISIENAYKETRDSLTDLLKTPSHSDDFQSKNSLSSRTLEYQRRESENGALL